jgi:hypothetical protein
MELTTAVGLFIGLVGIAISIGIAISQSTDSRINFKLLENQQTDIEAVILSRFDRIELEIQRIVISMDQGKESQ